MVIKIKTGKDDLHRNNIMHESADTSAIVDGFFGISPAKKQTEEPSAPKTQEVPAQESDKAVESIKKAAADTAAKVEIQKTSKNCNDDTTKEGKSEAEKSLNVWIEQMWKAFTVKTKNYPQALQTYANMATPSKFEKGILFIDVPTCFAKENIENNYLHLFTEELSVISAGIIQRVSVQCTLDVSESENVFFVKIHKNLIKDERITHAYFRVYAALLSYRNNKTGICRASIRQISDDFNIQRTTVERGLKNLVDYGYVLRNGNGFEFSFLKAIEKK